MWWARDFLSGAVHAINFSILGWWLVCVTPALAAGDFFRPSFRSGEASKAKTNWVHGALRDDPSAASRGERGSLLYKNERNEVPFYGL